MKIFDSYMVRVQNSHREIDFGAAMIIDFLTSTVAYCAVLRQSQPGFRHGTTTAGNSSVTHVGLQVPLRPWHGVHKGPPSEAAYDCTRFASPYLRRIGCTQARRFMLNVLRRHVTTNRRYIIIRKRERLYLVLCFLVRNRNRLTFPSREKN